MVSIQYSAEVLLVGKAILIAILGVLVGFISKYVVKKVIDKGVLRKIFKDASTYETSAVINNIFSAALMWIIIIGFFNYAITLLGFNFLTNALSYVISNIPRIAGFIMIIAVGFLIAKIVTARIKGQEIENKNEIVTLTELIILSAFLLTALEFIGVRATALIELYKVILYVIGVILVLLLINPKFFEKIKNKGTSKEKKK